MPNQLTATAPEGTDLNRVFKALSDPTRRTVVQRLAQGAATAGSLAASFEMALPSFLQHLVDHVTPVAAVIVDGGWLEIDTNEDLATYEALRADGVLDRYVNLMEA